MFLYEFESKTQIATEGPDYMAGHCHVMALALKVLHPDWQIRAHIGWDEDAEDDSDHRVDHVYIVAPDGSAYDCRGKFDNEKELVGPNETGGVETQFVEYSLSDIKNDVSRGELKPFTKQDIQKAIEFSKRTLAEAFDQPYPLKWEKSDYGDYDALAKLPDGTNLSIMFNNEYKKNWMVEFYRNNSQAVTGEGDAQRIFATVLHAIQQFIKKKKPTSLFFSAVKEDDPTGSRTKLYDRLVQRFATGLGYTVQKQEDPGSNSYKLKRIENTNKGVAENLEQKMSVKDTLAYLQKVMGTASHEDWRNHIINTNEYFVLKEVPVSSLKSDLSGLNKDNVEKYKQMDFSKAPPIVIGSDGNILDGYHRVNVAKALKVPTLKAWVGVKKQGVAEGAKEFNKCFDKACQLYDKALEKDLNPILYQVADYQGSAENADSKWLKLPKHVWSHYVTVIGDTVYDPTASQFGPEKETKYSLDKLKTEWGKIYKIRPKESVAENFADGKNPGRKGLAKRMGVNCKQSVSKLRKIAKNSSGERQRMAHWCANMKSGKRKVNESADYSSLHAALKDFLPVAMTELNLKKLPKIHLSKKLDHNGQPSFGSFSDRGIELGVDGRHPIDVCRTLAHELVHYKQKLNDQLDHESGQTGSPEENQANSVAGIIMRKFSKKFPQYMN